MAPLHSSELETIAYHPRQEACDSQFCVSLNIESLNQACWHVPVISALGRRWQDDQEFSASSKLLKPVSKQTAGVEEVADRLRAVVLAEDQVGFLAATWQLTTICHSRSRGIWCPLLTSVGTRHTHGVHTYIHADRTFIYIKLNKFLKKYLKTKIWRPQQN